jgi:hypothetical protein
VVRAILILVTVVAIIALMAGTFVLRLSPEIFDSGSNATTWSVFLILWLMPILLIAGVVIAWVAYIRKAQRFVILGLTLAVAPILVAAGIIMMAG